MAHSLSSLPRKDESLSSAPQNHWRLGAAQVPSAGEAEAEDLHSLLAIQLNQWAPRLRREPLPQSIRWIATEGGTQLNLCLQMHVYTYTPWPFYGYRDYIPEKVLFSKAGSSLQPYHLRLPTLSHFSSQITCMSVTPASRRPRQDCESRQA